MKACADCKWGPGKETAREYPNLSRCRNPIVAELVYFRPRRDLVTGFGPYCTSVRGLFGPCGRAGHYFEEREEQSNG